MLYRSGLSAMTLTTVVTVVTTVRERPAVSKQSADYYMLKINIKLLHELEDK
jgi:hypothetical protein